MGLDRDEGGVRWGGVRGAARLGLRGGAAGAGFVWVLVYFGEVGGGGPTWNTTRKTLTSSAGFLAISSAGRRATATALQLFFSSSACLNQRYCYLYLAVARLCPSLLLILVAWPFKKTLLVSSAATTPIPHATASIFFFLCCCIRIFTGFIQLQHTHTLELYEKGMSHHHHRSGTT